MDREKTQRQETTVDEGEDVVIKEGVEGFFVDDRCEDSKSTGFYPAVAFMPTDIKDWDRRRSAKERYK